jgi:hypothetical protein
MSSNYGAPQLCSFLHPAVTFPWVQIFSHLYTFLYLRDQVSHPYKVHRKVIVS